MKKKIILFFAISVFVTINVLAVPEGGDKDTLKYWKTSGVFSLNAAQSQFTNWSPVVRIPCPSMD